MLPALDTPDNIDQFCDALRHTLKSKIAVGMSISVSIDAPMKHSIFSEFSTIPRAVFETKTKLTIEY